MSLISTTTKADYYCEPSRPEDAYSALPPRCGCGGKLTLITNGRRGYGLTYYKCELNADGGVHDTCLWEKVVTDELLRLRRRVDDEMEIRTSGIESKVDNINELLEDWGDQLTDIRLSIHELKNSRILGGFPRRLSTNLWSLVGLSTTALGTAVKNQLTTRPLSCVALLCVVFNVCLTVYIRNS